MLHLHAEEKHEIVSFFGQLIDHWNLVVRLIEERFEDGLVLSNRKKNCPAQTHQALRQS